MPLRSEANKVFYDIDGPPELVMFAVKGQHEEALKTLIKHDLYVAARDKEFNIPIYYAIQQERVDIFKVSVYFYAPK